MLKTLESQLLFTDPIERDCRVADVLNRQITNYEYDTVYMGGYNSFIRPLPTRQYMILH